MLPLYDDNPGERTPWVTYALLLVCTGLHLWQLSLTPRAAELLVFRAAVIPSVLWGSAMLPPALAALPPPLTLVSSMFLHGSLLHLAGNMLYLWVFANNVEDRLGHLRFACYYLSCGVLAALLHAVMESRSQVPMLGASGAISGVLAAYLIFYPQARVMMLIPLGPILHSTWLSARWVVGIWFALQIVQSLLTPPGSAGVAWFAHIGGFVAGFCLLPLFRPRRRR